jgi:enoyl-CoA hydratase/carnithine racemase
LARVIAGKSPDAVRAAKRLLNRNLDTNLPDFLLAESVEPDALVQGANHHEAVAARLSKRAPIFLNGGGDA